MSEYKKNLAKINNYEDYKNIIKDRLNASKKEINNSIKYFTISDKEREEKLKSIIKWAKKNDIPVGPGRGSGAGLFS